MQHFLYTRAGAEIALNTKSLNYRIKAAKKLGLTVSKTIGGIEYFDLDVLENPQTILEAKEISTLETSIKKQIQSRKSSSRLQLVMF